MLFSVVKEKAQGSKNLDLNNVHTCHCIISRQNSEDWKQKIGGEKVRN